jgi:signal transduction histidine kinase
VALGRCHHEPVGALDGWLRSRAWVTAGVATFAALAVLTVQAHFVASHLGTWAAALDVAVGVVFVLAGVSAPGGPALRVLTAGIGVAWLAAALVPAAGAVHQALLLLVLAAFPLRRMRGAEPVGLTAVAATVALGLVPQLGLAVLFGGAAVGSVLRARSDGVARPYPPAAAAGVAAVLVLSWIAGRYRVPALDPTSAFLLYQVVLLAAAVALWAAARGAAREQQLLAEQLLADWQRHDLDGLAAALGAAVGDPDLEVVRWDEAVPVDGGDAGPGAVGRDGRRRQRLEISRGDRPLAVVLHRSAALEDEATAAAVSSAVALVVTNLELLEEQQHRIVKLEQARARVVAAANLARERAAADLRENVQPPLALASSEVRGVAGTVLDEVARDALDVVADQLDAARSEIGGLVAGGGPPFALGHGRLEQSVLTLAGRSPVPVSVTYAPNAAADAETESALYYVIAEALTNVAKHARATRVEVVVRRVEGAIEASVSDDGDGGADPGGWGLTGLADRLTKRGGRLHVESPTGAGTTLTASVPVRPPQGRTDGPNPIR